MGSKLATKDITTSIFKMQSALLKQGFRLFSQCKCIGKSVACSRFGAPLQGPQGGSPPPQYQSQPQGIAAPPPPPPPQEKAPSSGEGAGGGNGSGPSAEPALEGYKVKVLTYC